MSISSKAIAMYGVYFSNLEEVLSFCQKFYPEIEDVEDLPASAEVEMLDYFSGTGVIVGYHVKIGETLEKYEMKWNKDFPNSEEKPNTHLEVVHY